MARSPGTYLAPHSEPRRLGRWLQRLCVWATQRHAMVIAGVGSDELEYACLGERAHSSWYQMCGHPFGYSHQRFPVWGIWRGKNYTIKSRIGI